MTTSPVIVVGENLIDLFVHPQGAIDAVIGGGPFNVAYALGSLGQRTVFVSGISTDAFGRLFATALREANVSIGAGPSTSPTTLAIVDSSGEQPRYAFHLRDTASFDINLAEALATLEHEQPPVALYVGTLGLVVEPMATIVEEMVQRVNSATLVLVDPNCRPSATDDPDSYRARLQRLLRRADVVKVSTEDLDFLSPGLDYADAASALRQLGPAVVIVTDGPDVVHVHHADGVSMCKVPAVSVIDTVGAGDALVGGFLRWWTGHDLGRQDLQQSGLVLQAVQAAIDIAGWTCQHRGATPPKVIDALTLPRWTWLEAR